MNKLNDTSLTATAALGMMNERWKRKVRMTSRRVGSDAVWSEIGLAETQKLSRIMRDGSK